jgi:hypothetical protein
MLKRFSAAAASIVVIAFFFVSITHACSGFAPVTPALQQSPMNMDGDNTPCSKGKGDICQSVRDSILSDKSSISASSNAIQRAVALQPAIGNLSDPASLIVARRVGVSFPPIFNPPLIVSFTVLRI